VIRQCECLSHIIVAKSVSGFRPELQPFSRSLAKAEQTFSITRAIFSFSVRYELSYEVYMAKLMYVMPTADIWNKSAVNHRVRTGRGGIHAKFSGQNHNILPDPRPEAVSQGIKWPGNGADHSG